MKLKISKKMVLDFSIIWLIVASGSEYFMNQNMPFTTFVMLGLAIILLYKTPFPKVNLKKLLGIIGFMGINTLFNLSHGIYFNDIVINISKLIFVMAIASLITWEDFANKYIYILTIMAVLSLICYAYIQITKGGPIPFQQAFYNDEGLKTYTSFYHTVGWEPKNGNHYYTAGYGYFTRNAGIFWEPGAYQFFLNIALWLSFSGYGKNVGIWKWTNSIIIVTVLTTQSTTGFICLILNFIYFFLMKNTCVKLWKKIAILFSGSIAIIAVEMVSNTLSSKLVNRSMSYATRMNDTFSGLELAMVNPILGNGIFAKEYIKSYLAENGIVNISNGLIGFALNVGIVILLLYLIFIFKKIYLVSNGNKLCTIIAFSMVFIIANSESIFLCPLFLIFIFSFSRKKAIYN